MHTHNEANVAEELEIIWLRPKEKYDYLREGYFISGSRHRPPPKATYTHKTCDGGLLAHVVAYAVLKPGAASKYPRTFWRRLWWVKTYDRWVGHGTDRGHWYETGCPCEGISTETVIAGQPSLAYDERYRVKQPTT